MASTWCLIQGQADKFIKGLKSGEIDSLALAKMASSEARRNFLAKYVGEENAKQVNALYESKLLLKDQQEGLISWIKRTANLNSKTKTDFISRISKMNYLNPSDLQSFKQDLISSKLKIEPTLEETQKIFDLSQRLKEAQKGIQKNSTFLTNTTKKAYGDAKVALVNYINELKDPKLTIGGIVKDLPGITKAIAASMDDSAIFRQGWKTLMTNPIKWQKNARQSFVDLVKEFSGKSVMDEVHSDMFSRQNELNGNYKKMGLALSKAEEAYPTSLPERVPLLGRAYKASESAYTGFVYRMRMDVADKYLEIAQKSGVEFTDKELKSIGSMVNSLTGRGNLGKYEPAANLVNNIFFSPRKLKADFDTVGHVITGAGGSNFVRKQAAVNLVKVIAGTAAVLAIANAVKPGSVESDTRSSDFGKIKVGDTRFDVTGGMASLITLAARLATMSSKSSTTGRINPLNSGNYGSQTGWDVVTNFFTNKLSPVAQVVKDLASGKDFSKNKVTLGGEAIKLVTPLPVTTLQELMNNPNSANVVLSMIADALGISTNTYSVVSKTWSDNPTKTQQQFLDKVGNTKFKAANDKFNLQYNAWVKKTTADPNYKKLSLDEQQSVLTTGKKTIQDRILKSYGFTYKTTKPFTDHKQTIKNLKPK